MAAVPEPHTALFIDENRSLGARRDQAVPEPDEGELLVETLFSGTNPADVRHGLSLGIYPCVMGYDFCGRVLQTPPESNFRPGDIVAGYTPTGLGRPARFGAHQQFLACPEEMAFSVPDNLPQTHAAALTVVTMTAADTLYNLFGLPLPLPQGEPGNASTGPILIWGASSSVGLCAVQLARASGASPIFVTASKERHVLLRELGATHCFDYRSDTVTEEIQHAVRECRCGDIRFGFDAVGGEASGSLVAQCVASDARLASVILNQNPRFKMPFATTNREASLLPSGMPHPITVPARRADFGRAWSALRWAVENYGSRFKLPKLDVFEGTAGQAIHELQAVASLGRGFGKLVLKHPLA